MGYGPDIKEKAFQLYVQGASFDEISEATDVNRKTLMRWEKREGWKLRRAKILEDIQKKNDEKQAEILSRLDKQTIELWEEITDELRRVTRFRTKEGAVAAYIQMSNMILKLRPQKTELKIDEVLEKILKVLWDHPKIGIVLDKYKDEIIEKINKELNEN